ncbi:MAG TPA: hypothetical protein VJW17_06885, partial [Pyrinomonadaceae bacterium]|nr:hypothetical protein [Pyrinomonadaceae bacterium]
MEFLIFLLVLLTVITLVGHLIWVVIAAFVRLIFSEDRTENPPDDLAITERQIGKFYSEGKLNDQVYEALMKRIRAERDGVAPPESPPVPERRSTPTPEPAVVTASLFATDDKIVIEPTSAPVPVEVAAPPPRTPRRSFSEVLTSFMEESNIRWGEIIGGLLIIGCSTALVVSLWAQISQIPVLKFLIFTTVTAILFGIGLYTEHRWKLPTTSRGILTTATLLVPLNFLAIAAVSASNTSGALVIGSELIAPAIFLCLVYFAGRIITPGCAHILSGGVLGSSIGQLLVRHFAAIDASPALLIFLGAFPVACYVATVALALRVVLHDREIDESETTTVFTVLGTMSFAALLPFGLLLYRSGPMGLSMMYLAPLVTLWGLPMLATGTILWRRINNKELVASRTTGTALGILGVMIVLAGMVLAWPNPASIVPAALFNFAIFTALAVALELPIAHLIAAVCFALGYLVAFHVFSGNIPWINLRVMSLLFVSLSEASGEALVGTFALFTAASEWLSARKRERDSHYYLIAACLTAVVSLLLAQVLAIGEHNALWIVYGLYALGAFWIAWRRKLAPFTWVGSGLLLFSLAHTYAHGFSFPWQTALFTHATLCALAAIVSSRYEDGEVFSAPLNYSALISLVLGVVSLFQANTWEVTWMQAQRVYWIAGILLLLLWLNRRRIILNSFQIALICALVLTVKAALQQYDWYSYLPHAFLRPAALQIQGTILVLFCLGWVALRLAVKRGLLIDHRYSVDRLLLWFLLAGFMVLAVYGSLSGLTQELGAFDSDYAGFNIAGFPHQEALAVGSWILLGLLTITLLASFWERRRGIYLLGAVVALSAAIPLLAGQLETQFTTATAWRWLAAMFLLGGSVVLWYRDALSRRFASFGWPAIERREVFVTQARTLLIALTVAPLLVLSVFPALRAVLYFSIQTPASGSFSYGLPLVLVALTLIGYALRERIPVFTFYAGAFFNLTVTVAFLLTVAAAHGSMDHVVLIRVVQLNALTFAAYSLPWLSTRRRWQAALSESEVRFANYLLKLQVGLAIVLNLWVLLPVVLALVFAPDAIGIGTRAAGSLLGWLALGITDLAIAWLAASRIIRLSANALAALLLAVACLAAFTVAGINGWLGLHTLTVLFALSAWLMLATEQKRSSELAAVIGVVAAFLSVRTLADADMTHWWSIGPLLAITALAVALNWNTLRRRYIYAAGLLFTLTVSLWWIYIFEYFFDGSRFLFVNVIAGSLAGVLWLWLELRSRRLRQGESILSDIPSLHNLAAVFWLGLLSLIVLVSPLGGSQSPLLQTPLLSWLAFLSVLTFMMACLWDRSAKYAVAGLYVLGLMAGAIMLQQLELSSTRFAWSATNLLSAYTLAVALLWHFRRRLITFADQFGVPRRLSTEATNLNWLSAVMIVAVVTIALLAYWIDLRF